MKWIVFLLTIFTSIPAWSQTAFTILKADSLKPGDIFDYTIVLKKDKSYDDVILPDSTTFGEEFEIVSVEQFRNENTNTDSIIYKLQFFGVEDQQIPETEIGLVDGLDTIKVKTDIIPLFYSSLQTEENSEVKPLKPIYEFAINYWLYLVVFIVVIFALVLIYQIWKKQKRSTKAPQDKPEPFIDPIKQLEDKLLILKNSELLSEGNFKLFYIELTNLIRTYFEFVYSFEALEMTTSEIKYALLSKKVDNQILNLTLLILTQADFVKFAKFKPTIDSSLDDLQRAFDLVKLFRSNDRSRISNLKYQYELENGLIKQESIKESDGGNS